MFSKQKKIKDFGPNFGHPSINKKKQQPKYQKPKPGTQDFGKLNTFL